MDRYICAEPCGYSCSTRLAWRWHLQRYHRHKRYCQAILKFRGTDHFAMCDKWEYHPGHHKALCWDWESEGDVTYCHDSERLKAMNLMEMGMKNRLKK